MTGWWLRRGSWVGVEGVTHGVVVYLPSHPRLADSEAGNPSRSHLVTSPLSYPSRPPAANRKAHTSTNLLSTVVTPALPGPTALHANTILSHHPIKRGGHDIGTKSLHGVRGLQQRRVRTWRWVLRGDKHGLHDAWSAAFSFELCRVQAGSAG